MTFIPEVAHLTATFFIEKNRNTMAKAKVCKKCKSTPTFGVDKKGAPLCADCKVTAMRKLPEDANWQVGQIKFTGAEFDDLDRKP